MVTTKTMVKSACTAMSTAVFGYWRDATGLTKPLVMVGSMAEIITVVGYVLGVMDWGRTPWIPVILDAVVSGIFGEGVMLLGTNCIVIGKSSHEERTMRIQVFSTMAMLAALFSMLLGGLLLASYGYQLLFGIAISFHLFALICVLLFVEDGTTEERRRDVGATDKLKSFFKRRQNIAVIWLMMLCGALCNCIYPAESSLSLYFYQLKFHFTFRQVTLFGFYHFFVAIVGSFVMALLITKVFKLSDFVFGLIGSLMTVASSTTLALANSLTVLFLSGPLNIMRMNLYSIPASIVSKCIRNDELGVYLGMGSIVGIVLPFGINYLYNYVFSLTTKTMPGAFFLISAVLYLFVAFLFGISSCFYTKPEGIDYPEDYQNIVHQEAMTEELTSDDEEAAS